jgi:hypothetical protein
MGSLGNLRLGRRTSSQIIKKKNSPHFECLAFNAYISTFLSKTQSLFQRQLFNIENDFPLTRSIFLIYMLIMRSFFFHNNKYKLLN